MTPERLRGRRHRVGGVRVGVEAIPSREEDFQTARGEKPTVRSTIIKERILAEDGAYPSLRTGPRSGPDRPVLAMLGEDDKGGTQEIDRPSVQQTAQRCRNRAVRSSRPSLAPSSLRAAGCEQRISADRENLWDVVLLTVTCKFTATSICAKWIRLRNGGRGRKTGRS